MLREWSAWDLSLSGTEVGLSRGSIEGERGNDAFGERMTHDFTHSDEEEKILKDTDELEMRVGELGSYD